jgi:hypothetical protein
MAIVTHMTRRVDVPHEPGEWIELRSLGWAALEQCEAERLRKVFGRMRDTRDALGADLNAEIQKARDEQAAAAQQSPAADAPPPTLEDVANRYDQAALLLAGIAAWSYAEPVSAATIAQLDPVTAKWATLVLAGMTISGHRAPLPEVIVHEDGSVEVRPVALPDPSRSGSPSTAT